MFEVAHVNVPQGAPNGRLTRQPAPLRLKGGQQKRCVTVNPVGNRGGAALLTEHGTRNDAKQYRPCVAFAARVARVGHGSEGVEQAAIWVVSIVVLLVLCGYIQGYATMDEDFDRALLDPSLKLTMPTKVLFTLPSFGKGIDY